MGPADVANHASAAAADVIPGLAPWVKTSIAAAVFAAVSAAGAWGYLGPAWKKAAKDLSGEGEKTAAPMIPSATDTAMTLAVGFDIKKLQGAPDTLSRIEQHIEYQNKALDDLIDAQNRTTQAVDRQALASDRLERATDRNTGCIERLVGAIEQNNRVRERYDQR